MPRHLLSKRSVPRVLAAGVLALAVVPLTIAGASSATAAPDDVAVSVPIVNAYIPGSGVFEPVVEVTIGDSRPLRLMLDEGSQDLVINPGVLDGVTPAPVSTGITSTLHYNGGSIPSVIEQAPVTIGGLTTDEPVVFAQALSCDPHCLGWQQGLDGILGVSQGYNVFEGDGVSATTYSALRQLPGEAGLGHTVSLTAEGGTLTLGRPQLGDDVMVLHAGDTGQLYPDGQTVFSKNVPMCWTIATATQCLPTIIDSGEYEPALMGDVFLPWVQTYSDPQPLPGDAYVDAGRVIPGNVISFSQSEGDAAFSSMVATGESLRDVQYFTGPAGSEQYNTGNVFYLGRSIGFDGVSGEVFVTRSKSVPSAPLGARAEVTDRVASVTWEAPDSSGDSAVDAYVVTVQGADGKVVDRVTTAADARRAELDGLAADRDYTVTVAAANLYGVGADSSALPVRLPARPSLAATGVDGTPFGLLLAAAVAAVAAGSLLARRRRLSA